MTATPKAEPFICLYSGPGDECWWCGGWTKAAGGPFAGDPKFCSEDCFADFEDRRAAVAAREQWCPSCGFDQGEHSDTCTRVV